MIFTQGQRGGKALVSQLLAFGFGVDRYLLGQRDTPPAIPKALAPRLDPSMTPEALASESLAWSGELLRGEGCF